MRGHEEIIAMRHGGHRPDIIFIHVGIDNSGSHLDWQTWTPKNAEVEIADASLAGLDLRFTVGLLVWVSGQDQGRVSAIHIACLEAGAKRVVSQAVTFDDSRPKAPGVLGPFLDSGLRPSKCA